MVLATDSSLRWTMMHIGAAWRGGRRRAPAAHAPPGRPPPGRPPPGRPPREAGEAGGSRTAAARESNTPETLDTDVLAARGDEIAKTQSAVVLDRARRYIVSAVAGRVVPVAREGRVSCEARHSSLTRWVRTLCPFYCETEVETGLSMGFNIYHIPPRHAPGADGGVGMRVCTLSHVLGRAGRVQYCTLRSAPSRRPCACRAVPRAIAVRSRISDVSGPHRTPHTAHFHLQPTRKLIAED